MSEEDFQRARRPEQKEERRALLLDAARAMLLENPRDQDLSLNELARRAGMAKSNVYRYFESREAILLELLRQAWGAWFSDLHAEFARQPLEPTATGAHPSKNRFQRVDRLARKLSDVFARQPLLGHLCSILASVLEHNVELETIRAFKLESLVFVKQLGEFLHGQCDDLSAVQYQELFHTSFAALVGLWSLSHPSSTVEELLRDPQLAPFRHDFARDFARHLSLLARGLVALEDA